ncbi:MAG: DUF3551 domain-containing protein [Pseudolabrys sp.]|nr:DUF3551 domain-containing protein [Pseudolabrys sp.]MDP2294281.1 DUF3551 domain-containing protein [Pseudolabrys sp.]
MLKSSAVPFAIAVLAALSAAPSTAQAGVEYPYCAIYSESIVGGTNCGFVTLAQCLTTVHGLGGICNVNPAYPDAVPVQRKRPRAARH